MNPIFFLSGIPWKEGVLEVSISAVEMKLPLRWYSHMEIINRSVLSLCREDLGAIGQTHTCVTMPSRVHELRLS